MPTKHLPPASSGDPGGCWNHHSPSGLMLLRGPAEGHRWASLSCLCLAQWVSFVSWLCSCCRGVRRPRFLAVVFEWGLAIFQCVVSQARIATASWKNKRVWLTWAGPYMETRAKGGLSPCMCIYVHVYVHICPCVCAYMSMLMCIYLLERLRDMGITTHL